MTYVVGVGVGFFAFGVCTALSLARTAALADARVQRARLQVCPDPKEAA